MRSASGGDFKDVHSCCWLFYMKDRHRGPLQLPSNCRRLPSSRRRLPSNRRAELKQFALDRPGLHLQIVTVFSHFSGPGLLSWQGEKKGLDAPGAGKYWGGNGRDAARCRNIADVKTRDIRHFPVLFFQHRPHKWPPPAPSCAHCEKRQENCITARCIASDGRIYETEWVCRRLRPQCRSVSQTCTSSFPAHTRLCLLRADCARLWLQPTLDSVESLFHFVLSADIGFAISLLWHTPPRLRGLGFLFLPPHPKKPSALQQAGRRGGYVGP